MDYIPKQNPLLVDAGKLIDAYMDFLEQLSEEVDRNLNYEFNEYYKTWESK